MIIQSRWYEFRVFNPRKTAAAKKAQLFFRRYLTTVELLNADSNNTESDFPVDQAPFRNITISELLKLLSQYAQNDGGIILSDNL